MATEEIIIKTDKAVENIDSLTDSVQRNTGSVEEHQGTILDSAKNISFMGVSFNSVSNGVKGFTSTLKASVSGLKVFKIALAATGIGLIVVALGSLVTFLTKTQTGMDIVSKVMNRVKFVVEALVQRISILGEGLFKIVSGDFLEGLDMVLGSFSGIGEQIEKNIESADAFTESQRLGEIAAGNLTIQVAAYNKIIAEGREVLSDTLKTESERIEAGKKALKASNDLAQVQTFNLKRRIAELKQEEEAGNTLIDDINKRKDLEAQLIDLETQNSRTRMRIITQLNVVQTQFIKDQLELQENYGRRGIQVAEGLAKKEINIEREKNAVTLDMTKKKVETEVQIEENKTGALETLAAGLFNAVSGAFREGSLAQKITAIAEVILNGAIAVVKMWAVLGPLAPFSIPLVGAAVGVAIKKITNTQVPPAPRFARGGLIVGPSHDQGGVRMGGYEFEGGEAIMNKRSSSMFHHQLSAMNEAGGGVRFAHGGLIPDLDTSIVPSGPQFVPVMVTDDLHMVENAIQIRESRSEL